MCVPSLLRKTVWPSGLRRWLKAPFRKGVGSNPTGVIFATYLPPGLSQVVLRSYKEEICLRNACIARLANNLLGRDMQAC